jgi:DNA-binding XRE family transcriptional regulator
MKALRIIAAMIMKMMVRAKTSMEQDEAAQKLRVPQTCPNPYPRG